MTQDPIQVLGNSLQTTRIEEKATARSQLLQPIILGDLSTYPKCKRNAIVYEEPPCDVTFSHDFITNEVEKFGLLVDSCLKCSPFIKHFTDPRAVNDTIASQGIKWIKSPESIMKNPYPHLKLPITDPSTIDYELAPTRPKGFVQVTRQARHIDDQGEFIEIAKRLSVRLLRSLVGKLLITQEIGYKI